MLTRGFIALQKYTSARPQACCQAVPPFAAPLFSTCMVLQLGPRRQCTDLCLPTGVRITWLQALHVVSTAPALFTSASAAMGAETLRALAATPAAVPSVATGDPPPQYPVDGSPTRRPTSCTTPVSASSQFPLMHLLKAACTTLQQPTLAPNPSVRRHACILWISHILCSSSVLPCQGPIRAVADVDVYVPLLDTLAGDASIPPATALVATMALTALLAGPVHVQVLPSGQHVYTLRRSDLLADPSLRRSYICACHAVLQRVAGKSGCLGGSTEEICRAADAAWPLTQSAHLLDLMQAAREDLRGVLGAGDAEEGFGAVCGIYASWLQVRSATCHVCACTRGQPANAIRIGINDCIA
jgi:hypothetical protein